jgi:hypothetical protein
MCSLTVPYKAGHFADTVLDVPAFREGEGGERRQQEETAANRLQFHRVFALEPAKPAKAFWRRR